MCLASVYREKIQSENLLLSNVQKIECRDGQIFLTDLFERELVIEGQIVSVDLVGNTAVIRECLQ